MSDENEVIGTIEVKCHLRRIIQMAATQSLTMNVAVEMGLLPLLDKLASRASAINDPVAKDVLRILCLEDTNRTRLQSGE